MLNYKNIAATATAVISLSAMASMPDVQMKWPSYNGSDLELQVDADSTRFRLWSPMAKAARLNIYDDGHTGAPIESLPMLRDAATGTWHTSLPGQLYGKFYTFNILYDGRWLDETPGVWPKAVGLNGKRAAIIDMAATNPEGWDSDKGPSISHINDAVLYEMHHRDFSMSPSSGIANKGKFLALTEHGTTSPSGEKTGIDHLKELGITHVHILPSYDFNSVDEANLQNNSYNWGYDPQNYNSPEGSYSTNPSDPASRIREMKQMIKALHDAGIGVVMDVVYNHTAENDASNFELTAPRYYHRFRPDGSYSDASGCGNETASERPQMREFIKNSTAYWVKEFHIDGFRFDLMAIHDIQTMNEVAANLKKINPDVFIYGEGWTAGDSPLPVKERALKENVSQMEGISVFSDDIRDAIKGHYSDESDRGFASGKPGMEETVKIGIVGATAHPQVDYSKGANSKFPYAKSPQMVVNYVSCHDDLTLTDKLRKSMPDAPDSLRRRIARLAQTIVMTSQGTPFIFAGEELWRDKKGVHNSYKSPDSINSIDWEHKHIFRDQFDYYRELIALRKAHPAFRMTDAGQLARHLVFDKIDSSKTPNLISYSLRDNANGDSWKEIKMVFNGSDSVRTIKLPKGKWKVVARDARISHQGNLGIEKGGKIDVAPYSALILARE